MNKPPLGRINMNIPNPNIGIFNNAGSPRNRNGSVGKDVTKIQVSLKPPSYPGVKSPGLGYQAKKNIVIEEQFSAGGGFNYRRSPYRYN